MAKVYRAIRLEESPHPARCAVKLILPRWLNSPPVLRMFRAEVQLTRRLEHPNIVRLFEAGEWQGEFFMALELVDGVSTAQLLQVASRRGERFPLAAALYLVHEALKALAHAHSARTANGSHLGIVHRDISPGNILVSRRGDVKLTDFGIALSSHIERHTNPGELKGKYGYMSPEQLTPDASVDHRTDLFSLGVVLAETLMGRRLFRGRSQLELLTSMYRVDLGAFERHKGPIPDSIQELVYRALARDPAKRFQSAAEFGTAVRRAAEIERLELSEGTLLTWAHSLGVLPSRSGTLPINAGGLAEGLRTPTAIPVVPPGAKGMTATAPVVPLRDGARGPVALDVVGRTLEAQGTVTERALADLIALMATGLLSANSTVRPPDGRIRAVSEVAELQRFLRIPVYKDSRFRPGCAEPAAGLAEVTWQEPIERRTLPRRLYELVQNRKTGMLLAYDGWRSKRLYFNAGTPIFVASSTRRELLGVRLVRAGLVSPTAMNGAIVEACRSNRYLGQVLVERSLLSSGELMQQLVLQLEERVNELGSWGDDSLTFIEGLIPGLSALPSRRNPLALVTDLIRNNYGEGEIASLMAGARRCRVGPSHSGLSNLELLELDADEHLILEHARGLTLCALVTQLARRFQIRPTLTLRAIFIAQAANLLELAPQV